MIRVSRVVDLTQPLTADVAMWPGQPAPQYETKLRIESEGVFLREMRLWEHSGTHLDAPAHFFAGEMTVDEIPVERLVCPAVVIDIVDRCVEDPDAVLTVDDVMAHEADHGPIPPGSAVLVCTGWDQYVDDPGRYLGQDPEGTLHFPGFGEAATGLLVAERKIVGIGIDTLSVDAGADSGFPVHRNVTLPNQVWNLEELVRLTEVPARGALLVVGVMPAAGGSGSPARVYALLP